MMTVLELYNTTCDNSIEKFVHRKSPPKEKMRPFCDIATSFRSVNTSQVRTSSKTNLIHDKVTTQAKFQSKDIDLTSKNVKGNF